MTLERAQDFIFIDFEASGLGPESWPIEIGLAWLEGEAVRTWSSLIRPAADWYIEGWDYNSAQIHGISQAELADAPPARDVAETAAKLIDGKLLCSDAPNFDHFWAETLFAVLPRRIPLKMAYTRKVFDLLLDGESSDRAYADLGRIPAPHRAGPDAERYAAALLKGLMT
ncbi:MAG: 3'-5' exonuclease [Roseinatronobacter sp.]